MIQQYTTSYNSLFELTATIGFAAYKKPTVYTACVHLWQNKPLQLHFY